jgi:hypothetical protein
MYNKLSSKKVNALLIFAKSSTIHTIHNNAEKKIREITKSGTSPPVTLNMASVTIAHRIII